MTTTLRALGAMLLLAGGALHTFLALDDYGTADLATVFFLNGAASAIVAATLALGRGPLAPLAGVGLSIASLVAFAASRTGDGVLGFRGEAFDPMPEGALTVVVEVAAAAVLAAVTLHDRGRLIATVRGAARGRHQERASPV